MNDLTSLLLPNANHSSSNKRPVNGDNGDTVDRSEIPKIALESQFENFNTLMKSRLTGEIEALEKHKWKISVRKWEVEVNDMVKKFVDIVAGAKDFVGAAVSTNPQAALAWSAVCFGLQVSRFPVPLFFLTFHQTKLSKGIIQQ
jgi:N-terminal domain of NWD NACHT-NTPase